jgi:hypothetical protein
MTKFWFKRSLRTCRCEPVWARYLKNSESKNHQVWVFEKNSDSKNCQFQVFKKLQRTARFYERSGKDPAVLGRYWFFSKNSEPWLFQVFEF